jgi:hypothetical protein
MFYRRLALSWLYAMASPLELVALGFYFQKPIE